MFLLLNRSSMLFLVLQLLFVSRSFDKGLQYAKRGHYTNPQLVRQVLEYP